MSDLKNQEQLRDNIGEVLELSRRAWKIKKRADAIEDETEGPYPRSILFKTLSKHPAISAASLASVWLLGPARFSAMAITGISLFARYRMSILPIAQQVMSFALSSDKDTKDENNKAANGYNNNATTLKTTEPSSSTTNHTRQ